MSEAIHDDDVAEKIKRRRDDLANLAESDLPCSEIAEALIEIAEDSNE